MGSPPPLAPPPLPCFAHEKLINLLIARGGLGKVMGEAVGCCQKQNVTTEQDEAAWDHERLKNAAPTPEKGQLKGS